MELEGNLPFVMAQQSVRFAAGLSRSRDSQGVVESRSLEDNQGTRYTLVLFSRRSRLHPGMRYIARGLNSRASPGNEIECEQVRPQGTLTVTWSRLCCTHLEGGLVARDLEQRTCL